MDNKRIKNGLLKKREMLTASIEKTRASIQPKIDKLNEQIKAKTDTLEMELKFTDILLKQIDEYEAIASGKEPAKHADVQSGDVPLFSKKGKKA